MDKAAEELLGRIGQALFDKKGNNIIALDVRGLTSLTDFFLVVEGTVDRHVKALGDEVVAVMTKLGERPLYVEGDKSCDWLVLDFGRIIVHLFIPSLRERYEIEKVWKEAKIVDLSLETQHEKVRELDV